MQGSSCPRELSFDLFSTGDKRQFSIFKVFRSYLREFSIFVHEICLVARSYRVLAANIKILLIKALVCPETRLTVQNFAFFDDFGHFSVFAKGRLVYIGSEERIQDPKNGFLSPKNEFMVQKINS